MGIEWSQGWITTSLFKWGGFFCLFPGAMLSWCLIWICLCGCCDPSRAEQGLWARAASWFRITPLCLSSPVWTSSNWETPPPSPVSVRVVHKVKTFRGYSSIIHFSFPVRLHESPGQLRAVYRGLGASHPRGAERNQFVPGCCFTDWSHEGVFDVLQLVCVAQICLCCI